MENNHNNQKPTQAPNIDNELLKRKVKEFESKLVALQAEYGLIIVPVVNFTMFGAYPDMLYMTKEEYERRMKAGKEAAGVGTEPLPQN